MEEFHYTDHPSGPLHVEAGLPAQAADDNTTEGQRDHQTYLTEGIMQLKVTVVTLTLVTVTVVSVTVWAVTVIIVTVMTITIITVTVRTVTA